MFIASVGVDALTIVNALPYARQEDKKDLVKILDLMVRHCTGAESEAYERFKFYSRSQGDGEPFENFLTALRTLVRTCNCRKDSVDYSAEMIRDRIIMGIRDSAVRRRILMKNDAELDLALRSAGLLRQRIDKPLIWPQDRPEARCDTRKWRKYVEWGNAERRQGRAARMHTGARGTNVIFAAKDINAGCAIVLQQAKHAMCVGR